MGKRTTVGRIIVGIGGLLLIAALFLDWSGTLPVDIKATPTDLGGGIPTVTQDTLNDALDGLGTTVQGASADGFALLGWAAYLYLVLGLVALAPLLLDLAGLELEISIPQFAITGVCGLLALGGLIMLLATGDQLKTGVYVAMTAAAMIVVGSLQQLEENDVEPEPPTAAPTVQVPEQKDEVGDAIV